MTALKQRRLSTHSSKEPRLNIRYKNFYILDEIELASRSLGVKRNAWVKVAIQEKLDRDKLKRLLYLERLKGNFETRYLVRRIAGEEMSNEAKSHVTDYFKKVLDHES